MDALRCPPGDADVTKLSGGERRRVALCRLLLSQARPAAARRAHEPPRRRVGRVARALPQGVRGHGRRRHARPLLPRQRGRLDPRAGPRRGHPVGRQLLELARAEEEPPRRRRRRPSRRARRRSSASSSGCKMAPRARQAKSKARLQAYEKMLAEEGQREARQRRDLHPAGTAARQRRHRGGRPAQGLRRHAADRRPVVQAAARRHRRRDRPERRRQDDAVPHARRPGEARRRHAARRRDGEDRVRRPEPRRPARRQDRLGGDLRRQRPDPARQARGELARLLRVVQLPRRRPAEDASARSRAASATACTWPSCCRAAATCCCSTSPPTTSTWTRCARSKRRCSTSPAARS